MNLRFEQLKKLKHADKNVLRYTCIFTIILLCSFIYGGHHLWGKMQAEKQVAIKLENEHNIADVSTQPAQVQSEQIMSSTEATVSEELYYVYVCGAIEQTGVYQCKAGSRLYEVIEQAGGFLEDADKNQLNLVDLVSDGQKIYVPSVQEAANGIHAVTGQVQQEASNRINLNTASKEQLMTLPGIGESKAEDIIKYRTTSGKFQKIEDIKKISGIKDAAYNKIKDRISV